MDYAQVTENITKPKFKNPPKSLKFHKKINPPKIKEPIEGIESNS